MERDPDRQLSRNGSCGLQLFDQEFADSFDFDVLDPTKLIPEEVLPPIRASAGWCSTACVDNFFAETEQVAFMTQNVPPGIDFSNDPLLQGRNFSYLDTQLKRLGGPNFTHIPINAPKCPFHHFQQDGHMAMRNPVGRVNYEPNSFGRGAARNPRSAGSARLPRSRRAAKLRLRAGELCRSLQPGAAVLHQPDAEVEQRHIAAALIFELSKVETPAIRERMVSHLLNIDDDAGRARLAQGSGCRQMPKPADAAHADPAGPRSVGQRSASSRTDRSASRAASSACSSPTAPMLRS